MHNSSQYASQIFDWRSLLQISPVFFFLPVREDASESECRKGETWRTKDGARCTPSTRAIMMRDNNKLDWRKPRRRDASVHDEQRSFLVDTRRVISPKERLAGDPTTSVLHRGQPRSPRDSCLPVRRGTSRGLASRRPLAIAIDRHRALGAVLSRDRCQKKDRRSENRRAPFPGRSPETDLHLREA